MRTQHLGPFSSDQANGNDVLDDVGEFNATRPGAAAAHTEDSGPLAPAESQQLAHDIAEIERATVALRKAEPALDAWNSPPPQTLGKPHPVWLLIGALWISTALVALGAVVVIAALVG